MLKRVQQRSTTTDLELEHLLGRGAKGVQFIRAGEGKAVIVVFNYPGGWLYARQPHFSQRCIAKGQGEMVTQREILTRHTGKKVTVRVVKHWKHIGQTDCEISIFRDIKNSAGHGLEKPGLTLS